MYIIDAFRRLIESGANKSLTEKEFFELEIARWKYSPERLDQFTGERYYLGKHDVLQRKRTALGEGGELITLGNLPNNRIVDNQYARCVNQKVAYLLSKPITFESENKEYADALKKFFKKRHMNTLKRGGVDALNGGLFWLYVYYNEEGQLDFRKFKPFEILPFWKDSDHTKLDCAIRLYEVEQYDGKHRKTVEKVEIFKNTGIERYELVNGRLIEDVENPHSNYAYIGEQGFNWSRIPPIAFKFNSFELPLIKRVKGLQDALNVMLSDLMNNLQEDNRNTILVIKNYDGEDLSEFRKNLSTFGAVKVKTIDGADGGIDTLKVEVNAQNYDLIFKLLKKAIVENARSFDAKDERMGSNVNEMNLKSMYADIDLDADDMEAEFQDAFDQLLFFINAALGYEEQDVRITFNRDMIVNESQVIQDLVALGIRVPNKLLLEQLPFINNVKEAVELLKKEENEEADRPYDGAFDAPQNNLNLNK